MDDGFFENSYKKYCDFKHLNFVSPGTLTENIDEFTIDWFADLMTLIVGYLQTYKLNACIIFSSSEILASTLSSICE